MDQHARIRTRGIRTIGKLATPAEDDVLLAQWPQPADSTMQRQDVAVAIDWAPRRSGRLTGRQHHEQIDPLALFGSYDEHQRQAVQRLLDAIESDLSGAGTHPVVFEPPSPLQEDLLQTIRLCHTESKLSRQLASILETQIITAGEWVARCWALIELYRSGMITADELRAKRDLIEHEVKAQPPVT